MVHGPVLPASLEAEAGDSVSPGIEANLSNTVVTHLGRQTDRQKMEGVSKLPQLGDEVYLP